MASAEKPDFSKGIPLAQLADGAMVEGDLGGEDVLLARRGDEFFAVGAHCTHYGGPLAHGLFLGDEVRCPLHHACFSLRTGEALRAPALDSLPRWRVERVGDVLFLREKLPAPARAVSPAAGAAKDHPASVVIVGGGPAGLAAAEMLRRLGYSGPVTLLSADDSAPCDRPNLSKEYLAGEAADEWIPLRSPDFYSAQRIDLLLNSRVSSIDAPRKRVSFEDGKTFDFGALLLATGADPVRLAIPGAADSQIHYLRSFADARALVARAASARQVVIVGASFIALEVAASLRERKIDVHVVAPEKLPFERILGPEIGAYFRALHEAHGVVFHLEQTVARVDGRTVTLSGGTALEADFLVLGVGVRPSLALAEQAGLKTDRGILVNQYFETSATGIFAAGDVARYPDPRSGQFIRVEHFTVAERQGQCAARNILGYREPFDTVPFFWTRQYGVSLKYTGHAETWDTIAIDGRLDMKNCTVSYKIAGRTLAIATIGRDVQNLQFEVELQQRRRAAVGASSAGVH